MELAVVGRKVVGPLETGAVLELDVGKLARHLNGLVHVAVGGREDQLAAGVGEVTDRRDGAGVLRDVLGVERLDLVAERTFEREAALVVGPGPAVVADGAEEDETDLELVLRESAGAQHRQCRGSAGCLHEVAAG